MTNKTTYDYLQPTPKQLELMTVLRQAAAVYGKTLDLLPEGPDKTFTIRNHRTTAMWANVAATRLPDGTPRTEN
jgi:hypothetical protein